MLTHTCVRTGKCTKMPSPGSPCRHTSEHVPCRELGTHIPTAWALDTAPCGGFLLGAAGRGDKHCGHGSTGKGQDELAHCNPSSECPTPQQEQQLLPQEPSVALQRQVFTSGFVPLHPTSPRSCSRDETYKNLCWSRLELGEVC